MKINDYTFSDKISKAIDHFRKGLSATCLRLVTDTVFLNYKFTFTDMPRADVIHRLMEFYTKPLVINIKFYKTSLPWSKVIGYYDGLGTIFINERKLNSYSYRDYANTIAHEFCHLAGFQHGTGITRNYVTKEKLDSVPYKIGELVGSYDP